MRQGDGKPDAMALAPDSALVDAVHISPNIEPRRGGVKPSILLLHYTGMRSCQAAIELLASPASKVSCHYVIDEDGRVTQMVAEEMRAWHAGVSHWQGDDDVNSASIGIEIHNPGHDFGAPEFPAPQMRAVLALSRDIVARNAIRPERVLGHSDVTPQRKKDPGEIFDWASLARAGVGHWVRPSRIEAGDGGLPMGSRDAAVGAMQAMLKEYGYGITVTGEMDAATAVVVTAFQRHFRPKRVDGLIDRSTLHTLERLLAALPAAETS